MVSLFQSYFYIFVDLHIYVFLLFHMCVNIYMYIYMCVYIYICTYTHTYTYTYAHTGIHTQRQRQTAVVNNSHQILILKNALGSSPIMGFQEKCVLQDLVKIHGFLVHGAELVATSLSGPLSFFIRKPWTLYLEGLSFSFFFTKTP